MAGSQMLDKQKYISPSQPMPVSVMDNASSITNVSAEAVSFFVASTGIADAGSAAGTVIYATLAKNCVLDSTKTRVGNYNNSSFSWGTGTVLTTQRVFNFHLLENGYSDEQTRATLLASVASTFENGEYAIDHRSGLVVGKKATTGTSDTANYSYRTSSSSGTSNVNLDQVGGEDVMLNRGTQNGGVLRVVHADGVPQAQGTDATGQDSYSTIVTANDNLSHIYVTCASTGGAVTLSFDSGSSDHLTVPSGSIVALDQIRIVGGETIQAKNAVAGQNYVNLFVTVW